MTFSNGWRDSFREGYDHARLSGNAYLQKICGGAALVCAVLACALIVSNNLGGFAPDRVPAAQPRPSAAANEDAKLLAALKSYAGRATALASATRLFDSRFSLGIPPGSFSRSAALADDEPAAAASGQSIIQETLHRATAPAQLRLPPIRNALLRGAAEARRADSNTPAAEPTIFEKLFGKLSTFALAYAAPDADGLGGQSVTAGRYDRSTAVYDISAHTVYMPDGTRLEAHSGLGDRLDDPRHANERNRGVTPPNVYDLEPRPALFHGVRALRLIPVDDAKVFGRTGLLAHTFMLGPNGDSNGCVSFRNYEAFLQAYTSHQIKRLAVVTRLD